MIAKVEELKKAGFGVKQVSTLTKIPYFILWRAHNGTGRALNEAEVISLNKVSAMLLAAGE